MGHAGQLLALDAGLLGELRAGGYVHGVVLELELREAKVAAYLGVQMYPDAHVLDGLDLAGDDVAGQAPLRDAEGEDAAGDGGGVVDVHGVAAQGQVIRAGEAARAGADDGDALAVGRPDRLGLHALLKGLVGDETLDVADGDGRVVVGAVALKLAGMRADAAADRGEGVVAPDEPVGVLVPARGGERYVAGDVYPGGAGLLAGRHIGLVVDAGPYLDCARRAVLFAAAAADALRRVHFGHAGYDFHAVLSLHQIFGFFYCSARSWCR